MLLLVCSLYYRNLIKNANIGTKKHAKVRKFIEIFKKMKKKCIFFQKYLVMSKKSSTFALAFEKEVRDVVQPG